MKPSELIRLALGDLDKCEKSDDYAIEMEDWHAPNEETGVCEVCLAGSVMAQTLEIDKAKSVSTCDLEKKWENRLDALEEFRVGRIHSGIAIMGLETLPDREIARYAADPAKFKVEMEELAAELEGKGL